MTNELSSLARNAMARATSSGEACRPSGMKPLNTASACSRGTPVAAISMRCWNSLSTGPGWMVFTRMPRGAASLASVRMRPTSACLAVAYAQIPGSEVRPTTLEVMITLAPADRYGSACLHTRNDPRTCTASTWSKTSSG